MKRRPDALGPVDASFSPKPPPRPAHPRKSRDASFLLHLAQPLYLRDSQFLPATISQVLVILFLLIRFTREYNFSIISSDREHEKINGVNRIIKTCLKKKYFKGSPTSHLRLDLDLLQAIKENNNYLQYFITEKKNLIKYYNFHFYGIILRTTKEEIK